MAGALEKTGDYFAGLCGGYGGDFALRDSILPKKCDASTDPAAWHNVRARLS